MKQPLTSDRWRRVNELFLDAVDRPPAVRDAWLAARCAGDEDLRREVESLLRSDAPPESDASFARVVDSAISDAAVAAAGVEPAELVGPYRILHEIGQGGTATVFQAVRDDDEFQQRVAIKVVRGVLGADSLRRFRAERQILASLEHPSIARLLDGGTTPGGLPYLAMEYVDGVPIDQYCRERQLSIRERLLLFCRVCDAVSHAHRSLVVHRDIKPSNILVTADGTPKLLDFGIAKLLADDAAAGAPATVTGLRALTPEYASPEQVRGEPITTAADVYSLGVLLFELLTGQRPLAFATRQAGEIERVVCTAEPRKPSTVAGPGRHARQLAGDLDTIVLTALRKEPARRYPSAAHVAEEIRRHLDGLPVLARPATWRYRSGRFVRRHRFGVSAAVVLALVVIGFGVALELQRERVSSERDTAEQVTNLLLELYSSYDPSESRGARVTAQEMLDRGASRIQAELKDQPDVQARMLDAIGELYTNIGLTDRAVDVLRLSLSIRQSIGGETLAAARTLNHLAAALNRPEVFPEAEGLARQALDIRRRLAGPRAPETAESLNTLGVIQHYRGYGIEGAPLITEAISIWRASKGPDSAEVATGLRNLALTWRERADYLKVDRFERADLLKAERFERELLASRRKALGEVHALTAGSLSALGQILHFTGRDREAEPFVREALTVRRKLFGRDNHTSVIESIHNLAAVLHDQGKLAAAEALYREAVDLLRQTLGVHAQLAININNLATVLEDQHRFDEADAAYREAVSIRRQLLGPDHPGVARTLHNLARLMLVRGRPADALPIAHEALSIRRAKLGDADFETVNSIVMRGTVLVALDRRDEAEPLLRDGLAHYRRLVPAGNLHLATAAAAHGRLLLLANRPREAEPLLREALTIRENALYPNHPLLAQTREMLTAASLSP